MSNWRGFLAPPGISDEAKEQLLEIIADLHASSEWQEAVVRNSWTDSYMVGEELEEFIAQETEIVADLVSDLGL